MNVNITYPNAGDLDWSKLIESLGPHLLWAALIIGLFMFMGPQKITSALLSARKISFAGIEIELKGDLEKIAQEKNIEIPRDSQNQVSRRITRLSPLFSGARFLWIDDNPNGNVNEIRLLRRLGAIIDLATDDVAARQHFASAVYDIVLSDMARGDVADAGEKLIPEIKGAILEPIIIFYVGRERPIPIGALGLTVRPDELFNLIMDALDRRRA